MPVEQSGTSKTIVLVGHCGPDSSYLRMTVQRAVPEARVVSADDDSDLQRHLNDGANLVLMNRVLDYGFSIEDGAKLTANVRESHPSVKIMLVSNYPDAQASAVAAGALPGFGKRELGTERVSKLLRDALNGA